MKTHATLRVVALCALVLCTVQALAHEFWVMPSTFRPEVGSRVDLRLFVGDGFPGEPRPRDPNKLQRFFVKTPEGDVEVAGVDGNDPAGTLECPAAGLYVIGYRSNATVLTLEGDKFEAYLKEEGLDHVIAARQKAGTSSQPGRERYSRAAKSILRVSPSATASASTGVNAGTKAAAFAPSFDTPLNFPAEIIPQSDPTMVHVAEPISFVVMHNQQPAKNVLTLAFAQDVEREPVRLMTDDVGRVTLTPDLAGRWLIANVIMQPAVNASDADWESTWASLTLDVLPVKDEKAGGVK